MRHNPKVMILNICAALLLAARVQSLIFLPHHYGCQRTSRQQSQGNAKAGMAVSSVEWTRARKRLVRPGMRIHGARNVHVDREVEPQGSTSNELDNGHQHQQDHQRAQQRVLFVGAEEVAERLARGEGLEADGGPETSDDAGVFYNRVGAINRDLSVLMANVLAEQRIVERDSKHARHKSRKRASMLTKLSGGGSDGDRAGCQSTVKAATSSGEAANADGTHGGIGAEGDDKDGGLIVLDAFAASGVRALRYLTEVPGVQRVVANDHDTTAIAMIRKAAELCGVQEDKVQVHHGDALDTMYAARAGGLGTYDVIDIDPYGCAAGYLDAAVEAVTDGGLLCITSTDMPVLSGTQPAVAYSRYGSVPTRAGYHHEMSLRILLHSTSAAAGRHRRSIKPVLSVAMDHYVRVFVRVFRSRKDTLKAVREHTSYVLQSEACPSFFTLPVLPPQQQQRRKPVDSRSLVPKVSDLPADASTDRPPNGAATFSDSGNNIEDIVQLLPVDSAADSYPRSLGKESAANANRVSNVAAAPLPLPSPGGVCPETGATLILGGPIWTGPLHDAAWVKRGIALAGEPLVDFGEKSRMTAGRDQTQSGNANRKTSDEGKSGTSYASFPVPEPTIDGTRSGSELPHTGTETSARPRLAAGARAESFLRAVSRELPDVPLFYNLRDMFATLGLARHPQREQVMGALEAAGYRTSGMHKEPLALKTDAPDAAVWDVLRCWLRNNPQSKPPPRAAGASIVARGPQLITDADFDAAERIGLEGNGDGEALRGQGDFLHASNPEGRWGPISRGSTISL